MRSLFLLFLLFAFNLVISSRMHVVELFSICLVIGESVAVFSVFCILCSDAAEIDGVFIGFILCIPILFIH